MIPAMQWFGESWNAEVNRECDQCPTPVGALCYSCDEAIAVNDRGMMIPSLPVRVMRPIHYECFMRGIVGSVAHQKGTCSCFGGEGEDDPAISKRDAAIAAYMFWVCRWARVEGPPS